MRSLHSESDLPKISVIIPSFDGYRGGNVPRLQEDLRNQTVSDLEIHITKGVSPHGKARNMGAAEATGEFLVHLDDDIRLGHERIIENLIRPLIEDETIGMTGASIQIPSDSSSFQKACAKQLGRSEFPIVSETTETDMALNACFAIRKNLFDALGGFSEEMIRGVDVEFRQRVRKAGYRIVVVPNSWFYHPPPENLRKLMKMSFRNGVASAYGQKHYPELIADTPANHIGSTVPTPSFGYRVLRFCGSVVKSVFTFKFIKLASQSAYLFGYTRELFRRDAHGTL